jgi:sigma-B regulation protein RsbU (phosphoserine phosphatase)
MFYSIGRAIASLDSRNLVQEFEDVADRIQQSLLTITVPAVPGLDIGIRAAPARIVGGDYVDIIAHPGRPTLFAIGDASGKSLPAALRAMTLRYLVRGLASVLGDDLASLVARANEVVCADDEPERFVTFAVATVLDKNRTLKLANAGHDPPLIHRAATGSIEIPENSGLVLGVEAAARYVEQRIALSPGDIVAFYTDGFTEARNPDGEQFTLARVRDGLLDVHGLSAQGIADALFNRIEAYAAGTPFADDATLLVLRIQE